MIPILFSFVKSSSLSGDLCPQSRPRNAALSRHPLGNQLILIFAPRWQCRLLPAMRYGDSLQSFSLSPRTRPVYVSVYACIELTTNGAGSVDRLAVVELAWIYGRPSLRLSSATNLDGFSTEWCRALFQQVWFSSVRARSAASRRWCSWNSPRRVTDVGNAVSTGLPVELSKRYVLGLGIARNM